MTRRIALNSRTGITRYAIVDNQDYEDLSQFPWHLSDGYAQRSYREGSVVKTEKMHTRIMGRSPGKTVDHENRNRLDNRRENLRFVSLTGQARNCSKPKTASGKPTSSVFKGVTFEKASGKWRAQIMVAGKNVPLGRFKTEEEAARRYDRAASELHGEFAALNFA